MISIKTKIVPAFLAFAVLGSAVHAADAKAVKKESIMTSAAELKWEPLVPGSPLQKVALWGDRDKSEYAMLLKLPAGFEVGAHSHTADYHAVCLQGQWIHNDEGRPSRELGPTSYVLQPGRVDHNDVCKGPEDCILFIHQDSKGDFIPVEKGIKKK